MFLRADVPQVPRVKGLSQSTGSLVIKGRKRESWSVVGATGGVSRVSDEDQGRLPEKLTFLLRAEGPG